MDLVQVDDVGLQTAQAALARGDDVGRRQTRAAAQPRHAARRAGHLAGQHHFVARAGVAG